LKQSIIIHLSDQVTRAVSIVARDLGLHSDQVIPEVIEELLELLIVDHALRIQARSANDEAGPRPEFTLSDLLNPDVSIPVKVLKGDFTKQQPTLLESFDEFARSDPGDPWVQNVQSQKEDCSVWRIALATVYREIRGPERKDWQTWVLVERTFRILKSRNLLDNLDKPV
jgi:hypothetical protein